MSGWVESRPQLTEGDIFIVEGVHVKRRWWLLWEFWRRVMPLQRFTATSADVDGAA
jgi:hypothetical protein